MPIASSPSIYPSAMMNNNQGQQSMNPVAHTNASVDPYAAALEASFPSVTNNTISNNCLNFNNNINSNNNLYGGMTSNFTSPFPPTIPTTLNNLNNNKNNNSISLLSQSLAAAQQMMNNGQSQQYEQPIISRSTALANSINSGLNQSFNMPSDNTTINAASSSIGGSTFYNNNLEPASVTPPNVLVTGPSSSAKKSSSASHNHPILSNNITAKVCKNKTPTSNVQSNQPSKKDRRHSAPPPTSIILKSTPLSTQTLCLTRSDVPTHPVPEFLCHLYSMVNDPAISNLISWNVPISDEGTASGGGMAGVGKVVIHDPTRLQDEVLGKYYRHSKYSSFQRQLNYFGFKKRVVGTKKGKMSPCSFIHESLSANPHSLLNLKRRAPTNKRTQSESDLGNATVVSAASTAYTAPAACCLVRPWSNNTIKKSPKSKGKSAKSKVKKEGGIQNKLTNVSKKNASWNHALNTPQQSIPRGVNGPLRMTLIRQVPGQVSWSKSSSTSLLPKKLIPEKKTGLASIDLPDATNDTILEAQKLLEQNFRKTIQQGQPRPLQHDHPPQEQQSGPSYPQQQQAQQPLPLSMLTSNVQQSQQLIKLLQNHASALQMNDNGKVLWHQFNFQQQQQQPVFAPAPNNPNCMNMGQVEKFSFPQQANNTDTMPAFAPNFAAKNNSDPQAVDNNFFGNFPSKSPDLLLNSSSHNNFGMDVDAANAANTMSTNYLMTASSDPPVANQNMMQQAPTRTTLPITTNTTNNVSPPQGMMNTPPPNQIQQQLDDLLNNLLSTALPPSDELFDDDMSAGDVSEFGDLVGEGLQVSDDGGMLGLEP